MKKTGLYGYVYDLVFMFSVDYGVIAINDVLDIHNHLIKEYDIKRCLDFLKRSLLRQWNFLDVMH